MIESEDPISLDKSSSSAKLKRKRRMVGSSSSSAEDLPVSAPQPVFARNEYRRAAAETETQFLDKVLAWKVDANMKIESEPLSDAVNAELALCRKGIVEFDNAQQYVEFFESLMFEDLKAKMEGELASATPARIISVQSIGRSNNDSLESSSEILKFKIKLYCFLKIA